MKLFTVKEVSAKAEITVGGVNAAIHAGQLRATKMGNMWLIEEPDFNSWNYHRLKKKEPIVRVRKKRKLFKSASKHIDYKYVDWSE